MPQVKVTIMSKVKLCLKLCFSITTEANLCKKTDIKVSMNICAKYNYNLSIEQVL